MISTKRASKCEESIKQHVIAHNPPKRKANAMWGHPIEQLVQHQGYGCTVPLPEFADGGNYEENRRVEMRLVEEGEDGYCCPLGAVAAKEGKRPRPPKKDANAKPAKKPMPRSHMPIGTHHGHCWLRQAIHEVPHNGKMAVSVGEHVAPIAIKQTVINEDGEVVRNHREVDWTQESPAAAAAAPASSCPSRSSLPLRTAPSLVPTRLAPTLPPSAGGPKALKAAGWAVRQVNSLNTVLRSESKGLMERSATLSRQHSQWDDFFALEGGFASIVSSLKLSEAPVRDGVDGGGGVCLLPMDLHSMDEVHALGVIIAAARRWIHWRRARHASSHPCKVLF